jgi:methyl-accepting chemotaxis protein
VDARAEGADRLMRLFMRLHDLTIATRLALGFGAVSVLVALLGAIAVLGLGTLQRHLAGVVGIEYPKIARVVDLERDVLEMGRSMRNQLLWLDIRDIRKETARLAESRTRLLATLKDVETAASEGIEQERVAAVKAAAARYMTLQRRFEDLTTAGSTDEGRDVLRDDLMPVEADLQASVKALVAHEAGEMDTAAASAATAALRLKAGIAAGAAAGLLFAVAVSVWIVRATTGPMRRAVEVARAVATGELNAAVDVQGRNETAQLLQSLHAMQRSLASVVRGVRDGAERLAAASEDIASGNGDLSARTEQQAGTLEETAASMEQLGATVRQNADNARRANDVARSVNETALRGGDAVSQVVGTMRSILESSRQIAEIIGVIDAISSQTHILALNAAVEAARAGEQGRGFAVVANEVRHLAHRSAEAAREVKALIARSAERVAEGDAMVERAGATMAEVVAEVRRLSDFVAEISRASDEQSLGVAQVGEAVTEMDRMTQANAALVMQSAAATENLRQQAHQLTRAVAVFRLEPAVD